MFKHNRLQFSRTVLLGSIFILGFTTNGAAQNTNKSKYPFQKNPFREGEILGPDSSSDPLPVELVEDPALGGSNAIKKPKLPTKATPPKQLSDKELLRDLSAKISDAPEGSQNADEEATTTLNAKDVEIATLVKSFSKIAKRNYVVDSSVKGKVTIHLAEGISTGEALRILDSVLLLKGFTSVPIGPNTYKIIQAKDAKKTTIPTVEQAIEGGQDANIDTTSDALVTQLIRLKNVQASDMQATLQQFVSGDGMITTFQGTNSLIVIDSAANIERIVKVVKQLDVPALDQDVTVIPVKYAQAKDIAEKISQILGQDDKSAAASTGAKSNLRLPPPTNIQNAALAGIPPQPGQPTGMIDSLNSGRRSLPAKVLADERTNSIVVVADQDTTKKVQALVEQLDSKVDLSGGKFYVVRLKHADAEDLSDVLNAVLGGGGGSGGSRKNSGTSGSSLNRRQNNSGSNSGFGSSGGFGSSSGSSGRGRFGGGNSGLGNNSQGNTGSSGGFTVGAGKEGSKVNFEGEVSIASDPTTNSIIVSSSKNDFLKVKEVVDILDVRRKQVLVESTLLEVSLDKNKELGFDLVGSLATDKAGVIAQNNTGGGLANLLQNPQNLANLTIAAASSGSITLPGVTIPSQALVLRAVQTNENVNVLSTPTILTTDNQEAEIVVGNNIPIVTSQATNATNLGNTFNNIERQDVGITLRLTPQIGAGDFVTMRIFVEISDVLQSTANATNGPSTSVRTSETNVEVKSGQMVITGGLIQDRVEESESGVPYWSDIPILGNLFSTNKGRRRRTNLLIFITPRILEDQFDSRDVTVEGRDKIGSVIEEEIVKNEANTPDRKEVLHNESIDKVFEKGATGGLKPTTITPPKILSEDEEKAIRASIKEFKQINGSDSQPKPFLVSVSPKDKAVTALGKLDKKSEPVTETAGGFAVVLRSLDSSAELLGLEIPGAPNGTSGNFYQTGSKVKHTVDGKTREYLVLGRHENVTAAMKSPLHPATWQKLNLEESLKLGSGEWTK